MIYLKHSLESVGGYWFADLSSWIDCFDSSAADFGSSVVGFGSSVVGSGSCAAGFGSSADSGSFGGFDQTGGNSAADFAIGSGASACYSSAADTLAADQYSSRDLPFSQLPDYHYTPWELETSSSEVAVAMDNYCY